MPRYSYVARDRQGNRVQAVEEAPDAKAVAAALRGKGLAPIAIRELSARALFAGRKPRRGGRPRLLDVATFVRQLSVMLGAGVALVSALDDLSEQIKAERPRFGETVEAVRNRVMGGLPLSAALKEHPRVFPPLVAALVRAGEESGNLEGIMRDLADYLDSQLALRRKVKGAMTYPAFIGAIFVLVVAALFIYFLPKFHEMFLGFGKKLPTITVAALGISTFLKTWWPALLGAAGAAWTLMRLAARTPKGRRALDRLRLRLPVIGQVVQRVVLVRFVETLATLQRSGVPILMALDIASDTAGNVVVENALQQARKEVMHGSFLSHELAQHPVFPRMLVRMVAVGEETGRIEELLSRAAAYYKDEVDNSIQNLTRLIEPVMICVIGIVVAFVLLSIYLPIFMLAGAQG